MTPVHPPSGAEPAAELEVPDRPPGGGALRPGVWINIKGRSVTLRGLRQPPRGMLRWLALLGPGVIAGAAGNDAGGIATYSQVGAQYGYELLWVLLLITVSLSVIQETAARLGAATGRGLLDLIRFRFGIGWALVAALTILIANGGLIVSEFVGVSAAANLIGVSKYVAVPVAAITLWTLIVAGTYRRVETALLLMTLVFFAYPAAAILARPDWRAVGTGLVVPTFRADPTFVLLLVALIGTTLTPYQQLFQQSSIVEKGVARRHYAPERLDTYVGMAFSNLMSAFIIIATAATLHVSGQTQINTAADAAKALEPVAGAAAEVLFAIGLLGGSLMAAAVLPLASAYALSEVFGLPKGVNLGFRRGRVFLGLFTVLLGFGALVALVPGLPVIRLLVLIQVLNGVLLPSVLLFILLLANDAELMGPLRNGRGTNMLGWGSLVLVTVAILVLFGTGLLEISGLHLFGS